MAISEHIQRTTETRPPMEFTSPPLDVAAFSPTVTNSAKQAVYTTVGSVYNPGATTPLKAPTRRCRNQRFQQAYQSPTGEAGLSALVSSLALNDPIDNSPPTTAKTLQQYSPLQQNYDRAVSPELGLETATLSSDLEMTGPSLRSGNLPPPPGLGFPPASSTADKHHDTSFGEYEGASPIELLASLSVKTLTNLASFPNPNQEKARMVLARGRNSGTTATKTVTGVSAGTDTGMSRTGTPSSLSLLASDPTKDRVPNSLGIFNTASGAPPPLTAGPPGLRQYQPTPFPNASKSTPGAIGAVGNGPAVQRLSPAPDSSGPFSHVTFAAREGTTYAFSTISPTSSTRASTPLDFSSNRTTAQSVNSHVGPAGPAQRFGKNTPRAKVAKVPEELPMEAVTKYYPLGAPAGFKLVDKAISEDWAAGYPLRRHQTLEPTAEQIKNQHVATAKNFYSGIEFVDRSMELMAKHLAQVDPQRSFGVIGGERARSKTFKTPPLSTADTTHAETLINMAFATLLSYKEDTAGWRSGFVEADPRLVDTDFEDNHTFFETQKKRRLIAKRTRRGY